MLPVSPLNDKFLQQERRRARVRNVRYGGVTGSSAARPARGERRARRQRTGSCSSQRCSGRLCRRLGSRSARRARAPRRGGPAWRWKSWPSGAWRRGWLRACEEAGGQTPGRSARRRGAASAGRARHRVQPGCARGRGRGGARVNQAAASQGAWTAGRRGAEGARLAPGVFSRPPAAGAQPRRLHYAPSLL